MTDYKRFLVPCRDCGAKTSKKYAAANAGRCKTCVTGISQERLFICSDCGERRLTAYQKAHGYHCDTCTRNVETTGGIYGY